MALKKSSCVLAALAAGAMSLTSTAAVASSVPTISPSQMAPWLAMTALSMAGGCETATAGAAVAQALPAPPGCVLPVSDAAAPPPVTEAPPPPPPAPVVEEAGGGMSPLLPILGLLAAGALIWLLVRDKNDDDEPISA